MLARHHQTSTRGSSFTGPERRSPPHIFPDNFQDFSTPSFSPFSLLPFSLHGHPPPTPTAALSSLAWFSLRRLPFKPKGVCQVPNPLAKRSKQTKRLVTYCSILERQKKWDPHRPGHCILPPFPPELLFHSFNPALVLSLLCQPLAPPPPRCPRMDDRGAAGGGG